MAQASPSAFAKAQRRLITIALPMVINGARRSGRQRCPAGHHLAIVSVVHSGDQPSSDAALSSLIAISQPCPQTSLDSPRPSRTVVITWTTKSAWAYEILAWSAGLKGAGGGPSPRLDCR